MLSQVWSMKADSTTLWAYFLYEIPMIVYRMTPASCLMGTIFTISFLSRSNELVALFSSGISLARVALPILMLTSLIAVCSFFISDKLVPPFTKKQNYIRYVEIESDRGSITPLKPIRFGIKVKISSTTSKLLMRKRI